MRKLNTVTRDLFRASTKVAQGMPYTRRNLLRLLKTEALKKEAKEAAKDGA